MKNHDKSTKKIVKFVFGKSLCLLLVSVLCFFVAFYSFGKIEKENTTTVLSKISSIDWYSNSHGRMSWVTFVTSTNQMFYLRTDELSVGSAAVFANDLKEKTNDSIVSISFTRRRDLTPTPFVYFFDMERVVSIECDGKTIISLDDYNSSNQGFLIGWVVVSALFFMAWLGYLLIKIFYFR